MLKLKNITELKNSIKGLNIRQKQAEERISELEDRLFEIIQSEGGKEKKEKTWRKPKGWWENIEQTNSCVMGTSEEKLRGKRQRAYSKI